ncbi:hypothetical protein OPQ81_000101 [Rhizoctonia solani]|nr:hypothetical protein OPQ81_000101 [Rhizoctonia solani]
MPVVTRVVLAALSVLDDVVEAGAGLDHGGGAHGLPDEDAGQAGEQADGAERAGRPVAVGKEEAGDEALGRGGGVGDGVGGPVGGQQEGGDVGLAGVVGGRGPELEEGGRRRGRPGRRGRRQRGLSVRASTAAVLTRPAVRAAPRQKARRAMPESDLGWPGEVGLVRAVGVEARLGKGAEGGQGVSKGGRDGAGARVGAQAGVVGRLDLGLDVQQGDVA